MKIINWLKETWDDIKSWNIRNWTMAIIAFAMLWYLDFNRTILQVIAACILIVAVSVPLTGFAHWGLTKLKFFQLKDENALVNSITGVFRSVAIIIAAILVFFFVIISKN